MEVQLFFLFGKSEFTILQNGMVSYTCKDGILSPGCLAYWSRWLELGSFAVDQVRSWQFAAQAEKCRWAGNCKFCNFLFFKNLKF